MVLAGGLICVYVPEGTASQQTLPDYGTGKDNYTFYESNPVCSRCWYRLEGWQIYRDCGPLEGQGCWYRRYLSGSGISVLAITCALGVPLSKKLNPCDAIYMIYYVVHTPNLQNASVSGCSSVVKYASKAN